MLVSHYDDDYGDGDGDDDEDCEDGASDDDDDIGALIKQAPLIIQ